MPKGFLDPISIPKFVNQLVKPAVYKPFSFNIKERVKQKKRWCIREHKRDVYVCCKYK